MDTALKGEILYDMKEKENSQQESNSLDEVLNDSDSVELETEPKTKEEEPKEGETSEDKAQSQELEPDEESNKGEENQESNEEPPSDKKESWTKTAVIAERRKRQELEKKVLEFESKFEQLQAKQVQKEKVVRPDPIDDPVGASSYDKQELENSFYNTRVSLSQSVMRSLHKDYDEMEKEFVKLAENDPHLSQQIRKAPNPAEFAYKTALAHIDSENFKNPDYLKGLKEQMKKEILAELVNNQNNSDDKSNVKLPKNLTRQTSVASNVDQKIEYKGTLDEVFGES